MLNAGDRVVSDMFIGSRRVWLNDREDIAPGAEVFGEAAGKHDVENRKTVSIGSFVRDPGC
jgi:hypothetical protein